MSSRYVSEWLSKAQHDLASCAILLNAPEPITDTAAFHAQQAVEKYLKAYLIHYDVEITKTHVISDLLNECTKIDGDFSSLSRTEITRLTRYAVAGRYPGDFYLPSVSEATVALSAAKEVSAFILSKLEMQ